MGKRKITENDIKIAYEIANKARESALFSLKRAKQLRVGADKMKSEYKLNKRNKGVK